MFEDFSLKNFIVGAIAGAAIVGAVSQFAIKNKILKKLDSMTDGIRFGFWN